jgi:hypothetical protein
MPVLTDIIGQDLKAFCSLPECAYILAKGETGVTFADVAVLLAIELTRGQLPLEGS